MTGVKHEIGSNQPQAVGSFMALHKTGHPPHDKLYFDKYLEAQLVDILTGILITDPVKSK